MSRRFVLLALVAMLTLSGAQQAFAWANGGPTPNHYGTHDWVLDNAIKNAGADGAWVNKRAALRATDDPDTYRTSPILHNFRDGTGARGAGQAVADLYYKAVVAYRAGDKTKASIYLGQMSHYYSDAVMPFHASNAARNQGKLHYSYELTVSRGMNVPGKRASWASKRTPQTVTDVRAEVVSAAAYARSKYPAIKKAYSRSKSLKNKTVAGNTRLVLKRGVNDLTDLIRSIPQGDGLAPAPTTMITWVSTNYPAQGARIGAWAKCTDANGRLLEGAKVVFYFPAETVVCYTGPDGTAHTYQNIGRPPLMQRKALTIAQRSSGGSAVSDEWYMATPPLGAGRDGVSASVSDYSPRVGSTVSADASIHSSTGAAVVGLPITFKWHYPDRVETMSAVTDSRGRAVCAETVTDVDAGERVYVEAVVMSGSQHRTSGATLYTR